MLFSAIRHVIWVSILLLTLSVLSFVILMRDPLNADLVTNNIYSAYYHYLTSLLQGDLGITYNGGESLKDLIFTVLPPTLELCFTALLLACILGIPLGVLSAVYNQRALCTRIAEYLQCWFVYSDFLVCTDFALCGRDSKLGDRSYRAV